MCLRIYRCGRRGLCGPNGDAHGGDSLLGECGAFLAEHGIFLLSHWTERDGHSCRGADAQCLAPAAAAGPAAAGRGGAGGPTWGALPVPAAGERQTAGWTVLNDALGRKTEPAWHGDCPHTMQAP